MKYFHTLYIIFLRGFFLLILIESIFGCVSGTNHSESNQHLKMNSQAYNEAFAAKHSGGAEVFVQYAAKETFKKEYRDIKKWVTFDETELIKIKYFKDGIPIKQSNLGPEEDFNEAFLSVRYNVVISPSNRVKSITVKQRWIKENKQWIIVPDLKPFFK